jgi:hypothetical protein
MMDDSDERQQSVTVTVTVTGRVHVINFVSTRRVKFKVATAAVCAPPHLFFLNRHVVR